MIITTVWCLEKCYVVLLLFYNASFSHVNFQIHKSLEEFVKHIKIKHSDQPARGQVNQCPYHQYVSAASRTKYLGTPIK